jgi:hypothetical protein
LLIKGQQIKTPALLPLRVGADQRRRCQLEELATFEQLDPLPKLSPVACVKLSLVRCSQDAATVTTGGHGPQDDPAGKARLT